MRWAGWSEEIQVGEGRRKEGGRRDEEGGGEEGERRW